MPKQDIKIGRYNQPRTIYLVQKGEHYLLNLKEKIIRVSENGSVLWGAKEAEQDMWVEDSGLWHTSLPSEHIQGKYNTLEEKL